MPVRYHKLVRDRIPEIIRSKGDTAVVRHACDDEEFRRVLRAKLQEEVDEFLENGDREELADILEVVEALALQLGWGWRDLMRAKRQKYSDRGGFNRRIILEES